MAQKRVNKISKKLASERFFVFENHTNFMDSYD